MDPKTSDPESGEDTDLDSNEKEEGPEATKIKFGIIAAEEEPSITNNPTEICLKYLLPHVHIDLTQTKLPCQNDR